jgi:hypothetical protein
VVPIAAFRFGARAPWDCGEGGGCQSLSVSPIRSPGVRARRARLADQEVVVGTSVQIFKTHEGDCEGRDFIERLVLAHERDVSTVVHAVNTRPSHNMVLVSTDPQVQPVIVR